MWLIMILEGKDKFLEGNIAKNNIKVESCVNLFRNELQKMIINHWAQDIVEQNLQINLKVEPKQNPREEFASNQKDSQLLNNEVKELHQKEAIKKCSDYKDKVISPLFVIVQKQKNCHHINNYAKKILSNGKSTDSKRHYQKRQLDDSD